MSRLSQILLARNATLRCLASRSKPDKHSRAPAAGRRRLPARRNRHSALRADRVRHRSPAGGPIPPAATKAIADTAASGSETRALFHDSDRAGAGAITPRRAQTVPRFASALTADKTRDVIRSCEEGDAVRHLVFIDAIEDSRLGIWTMPRHIPRLHFFRAWEILFSRFGGRL
jgi:hypothetical protein